MTTRLFRIESGANEDGLRLGIQDAASGEVLAHVILNRDDLWSMLRGGSIRLEGRMTDHLDRIGKTMVNDMVEVPKDITNGLSFTDRDERAEAAVNWARVTHPDWDTYQPRHTNTSGVRVVLRKWVSE